MIDFPHQKAKPAIAFACLRDIPGDARCTNESTGPAFDWRNSDRNRDNLPVSMASGRLERLDPLPQLQPAQDIRLLIPFVVGDDKIDRLSDHLSLRIAEHAFGRLVPADDRA